MNPPVVLLESYSNERDPASYLFDGFCGELVAERIGPNDEAVISRGDERIFQALVQPAIVVIDPVGLAVHQPAGADDLRAESLGDRLVAQTNAQQRQPAGESLGRRHRNAGLVGRARAGRDDDVRGPSGLDRIDGDPVVAVDFQLQRRIDLAQTLHQVVRERIVIVDHQNHGNIVMWPGRRLSVVSRLLFA